MNRPEQVILQRRTSSGGPVLYQRRSLQEANLLSLNLSGNQLDPSKDPRGQLVRQFRKAQRLDPSAVATEACISLNSTNSKPVASAFFIRPRFEIRQGAVWRQYWAWTGIRWS